MTKATNLSIENKKLKAQLNKTKGYATILAIQSRFVDDVRFGRVNSYPAQAWQDVYNVSINQVLGV